MMKAQEVETLRSVPKIHDPGLVGMQVQPEWAQGGFGQVTSVFGSFPCGAEDDKVVAITDQRPHSPSIVGPDLIEDMEGDVGE
jgi:hypothetical protein